MSNFGRLINRIQGEIQNRAYENSMVNHIQRSNKSHANCRATIAKSIAASRSLSKALTPTKAEIKLKNQKKMQELRLSIKEGILTKSMSSLDAIKLENAANNLQAKLYQRGLI